MPSFARTKIQLPRPRVHVPRPALEARLGTALLEQRCVLLCAAAGYGKTSALAWQIGALPPDVARAWVACDEGDSALQLFGALLVALDPFDLPWRTSPEALVSRAAQAETPAARRALLAELINALDASEVPHGVIAFDDLHRTSAPEINEFLGFWLERGSPRWTLAIATRSEPTLPLARWRADGSLLELDERDLRFDAAEARALAGEGSDGAALARLLERTQGWPAGLGLALASTAGAAFSGRAPAGHLAAGTAAGEDGRAAVPAATERSWFDLLTTEVIDQLPPRVRELLLLTSVLTELTPARAAAVSGMEDAARLLDEVARRGPFVTAVAAADAAEPALRLHDLFREALARRLRFEQGARLPQLLRRAADSESDPVRRADYLIAAQDWDAAETWLLDCAGELITAGAASTVQGLIDRFPAGERGRPGLEQVRGLMAWARWDWHEMPRAMRSAAEGYRRAGRPGDREREGRCLPYLALALNGNGNSAAMEAVLAPLREPARAATLDAATRCRILQCDIWRALAEERLLDLAPLLARQVSLLGTIPQLQLWYENIPIPPLVGVRGTRPALLRYVDAVMRRAGDEPSVLRGGAMVISTWLDIHGGDWTRAQATLATAQDLARWLADPPLLLFQGVQAAAQLAVLRADRVALRHTVDRVVARAGGVASRQAWPRGLAVMLHFGLRVAAQLDDRDLHADLLDRWTGLGEDTRRWFSASALTLVEAGAAALRGDEDRALALRLQLLREPDRVGQLGQGIELQLNAADGLLQRGRLDEARAGIARVCEHVRVCGEPGSLAFAGSATLDRLAGAIARTGLDAADQRLIVDAATRLREWQRAAAAARAAASAATPDSATPAGAAARPSAEAAATAPQPSFRGFAGDSLVGAAHPGAAREVLSEREHEVLRLIAAGQPNKVIARSLDISPHTVKRHVANILEKLGLTSRGQAAAWFHGRA